MGYLKIVATTKKPDRYQLSNLQHVVGGMMRVLPLMYVLACDIILLLHKVRGYRVCRACSKKFRLTNQRHEF